MVFCQLAGRFGVFSFRNRNTRFKIGMQDDHIRIKHIIKCFKYIIIIKNNNNFFFR